MLFFIVETNLYFRLPADYAITQLEALTVLCHFCILNTGQLFNNPLYYNSMENTNSSVKIFNNFVHLLVPYPITVSNYIIYYLINNMCFLFIVFICMIFKAPK